MVNLDSISPSGQSPSSTHISEEGSVVQGQETARFAAPKEEEKELTIEELIAQNPEFEAVFNKMTGAINEVENDPNVLTIMKLIQALIDLGQILNEMATANAARLSLSTKLMNFYSEKMGQMPIALEGDAKFKDSNAMAGFNQAMGQFIEIIRSKKDTVEEGAKRIQTLLQSSKDSGQSINDFIGVFIDLLRQISSKINR